MTGRSDSALSADQARATTVLEIRILFSIPD
jgi:hypothetical protein